MINIGIVGATGYTGLELLRLLASHSNANVIVVTSSQHQQQSLDEVFPMFRNVYDLKFSSHDSKELENCELVFFATPHATAMNLVAPLLDRGVRIIDLSADFRIKEPEVWKKWYQTEHTCPKFLEEAVYGLPEINRHLVKDARLIANPGCYPTAINLGLIPLLKQKLVNLNSIVVDAKSGVSGAGRKAVTQNLYAEVGENFKAYGIAGHRHQPEIEQVLSEVSDTPVTIEFVPHLLPMIRGILATVYVELHDSDIEVQEIFETFYKDETFVDVLPVGSFPDTASVRGSNLCRLGIYHKRESNRVVVISVIDNLVKGAAGQALQNMNISFGLAEDTGLSSCAIFP